MSEVISRNPDLGFHSVGNLTVTRLGRAVCVLMVVPACFYPNYNHPECGPDGECPRGWTCGAQWTCESPGECETFASQFDTCMFAVDEDLTLSGTITYDTGTHELTVDEEMMPVAHRTLAAGAGDVDAIFAHNVQLAAGAQLRATGVLPLAIVANGNVTLEDGAMIDVSSDGAGAKASCANSPMPGSDNTGGAGGGGGGGYGAAGGNGGGGNASGPLSTGGAGGVSITMPAGPVGGCPGAPGGMGILPDGLGGSGGFGGGSLYIVAADHIELGNMAVLTAGGGGGHGGLYPEGGGGGGGSGGMIVLESPHVIGPQARVAANGGGGGEGSDGGTTIDTGKDGETGSTTMSRALGGADGAPGGTEGGRGGSLEEPAGEAVTMVLGGAGGGGGGGVGFIHIVSADVQLGTISPAAQ